MNGTYVDAAEASVSIFDHGLLYGDGVFEGIRVFDGGLFRPLDHVARLCRSARTIGLQPPLDIPDLLSVIVEVLRRSELTMPTSVRSSRADSGHPGSTLAGVKTRR